MSVNKESIIAWRRDRGDFTLMLEHNLSDESIVVDIGAYTGAWIDVMSKKYKCNYYALEPVTKFYNTLSQKFVNNNKIHCYNFGLSTKKQNLKISINGDATSTFDQKEGNEEIRLVELQHFMDSANINTIDLMQLNVEGYEYSLLDSWIELGIIKKINKILIQFHEVEHIDFYKKREEIQQKLQDNGFIKQFDYPFVWECWKK